MMDNKRDERFNAMTQAPITPLLIRMSIPTIIGMLVSAIYNITDTFFISKTEQSVYIAAVGVVFNLMTFIQAIGFMFGHGSGNYMARRLGEKDYDSASDMAATGLGIALISGTAVTVVGLVFKKQLVSLLGGSTTPELESACMEYITTILLSVPAMTGTFTLNNQLRLQGNAADGMKGMSIGMLLNIILDPILIFSFDMGLIGAGVSTLIGQYVGFIGLFVMTKMHGNVEIEFFRFTLSGELMGELFGGGMPNFIRQGITTISGILLTHAAGQFGDDTISAMTITQRVCGLGFSVVLGFCQGFQPICGYNFGAERYDRVRQVFNDCLKITTIFLVVTTAITYFFAENIVHIFEKNNEYIIETATLILKYQCVSLVFMGYYTLVGMLLQNIGKFFWSSVVSSMRQGIFFIPMVLLLPSMFGLTGVMIVQPVADILSFVFTLIIGIRTFSYINNVLDKYW